jgi:hypothetical protein
MTGIRVGSAGADAVGPGVASPDGPQAATSMASDASNAPVSR